MKELQIIGDKSSNHIVRYTHSWIENNKTLYIQMKLCFNTLSVLKIKLNEFKRNNFEVMTPIEYYISSELFIEIIENVDYLHKQKTIHRDLKPVNIHIKEGINDQFIKLGDFGLAVIHEFNEQTHTKCLDTPRYVAPQILNGRKYDMKADIYNLGVTAEELLSQNKVNEKMND